VRRLGRRFWRDRRGVAALEFALLAPILVGLYLSAVEVTLALQAQRRMAHMASAMADMTSQTRVITTAQLDDVMQAGSVMAYPLPTAPLGQRIASLTASSSGAISVDWVRTRNFDSVAAPSVPAGFLKPNESAIVADTIYDYPSVFTVVLPALMRFQRHAYLRPRLSETVELR
jgi:Flp pilus assembly protein TadG